MSESLKSTHVRLCTEADRVLQSIADLEDKDKSEIARFILEEALLGRVHSIMLVARRYKGLGFSGILRNSEESDGK